MQNQQNNWYKILCDKINELSENFGLDDAQTSRFRDFIIGIARDQFNAGNRNGVGWAFAEARKKIAQGQPL
ncbi:hypothetical protein HY733_02895 [Candidatus Uhrbacteria bacterium]|nr:hypothetical protein [Candidatus Uhrbacteria bacterium]